jgi:hypothetical protein
MVVGFAFCCCMYASKVNSVCKAGQVQKILHLLTSFTIQPGCSLLLNPCHQTQHLQGRAGSSIHCSSVLILYSFSVAAFVV